MIADSYYKYVFWLCVLMLPDLGHSKLSTNAHKTTVYTRVIIRWTIYQGAEERCGPRQGPQEPPPEGRWRLLQA